jgi:hypothetical protein
MNGLVVVRLAHCARSTAAGVVVILAQPPTDQRRFSRRRDATVSAGNSQRDREVIPPVSVVLIRDQSRFPLVETPIKCRQYISVLKYRPFGVHFSVSPQFSFHAFVTEHINSLHLLSPRTDQQPCTQVSTTSSPTSCITPTHFSIYFYLHHRLDALRCLTWLTLRLSLQPSLLLRRRFRSLAAGRRKFNSDYTKKEIRMARLASILALALLALAAAHADVYWGAPNSEACPFTGEAALTCTSMVDNCSGRVFSNKQSEPSTLSNSFLQIQRLSVPENTFYEVPPAVLSPRRALVHFYSSPSEEISLFGLLVFLFIKIGSAYQRLACNRTHY